MKKKIIVVSASIATGILGSFLLKKNKQTLTKDRQRLFIGDWQYLHPKNQTVTITITSDMKLFIQGKEQAIRSYQLKCHRLSFLDHLGYEISLENREGRFYFHDETEDASYELIKK